MQQIYFVISYNRSIFVIPHSRCVFVISNDRSISTIRLNICIIYFLPTKQQIYFFTIHTTALFCTFELFLACQISYTFLPYHKIDLFSSFPTKHIILVILILATFSNPVTPSYEGDIWVYQMMFVAGSCQSGPGEAKGSYRVLGWLLAETQEGV